MKTKFKMLIFLFIVEIGLAMVYVSPVALNFVSNSQEYYESGGIIRYNFFIDAVISQDGTEAKWCEDKFIDMKVEEWGINYFSGGYRPQNDFGNWYLKSIDMTFNGKPLVMKIKNNLGEIITIQPKNKMGTDISLIPVPASSSRVSGQVVGCITGTSTPEPVTTTTLKKTTTTLYYPTTTSTILGTTTTTTIPVPTPIKNMIPTFMVAIFILMGLVWVWGEK